GQAQVVTVAGQLAARLRKAGSGVTSQAHAAEGEDEQLADVAFVVDHQCTTGIHPVPPGVAGILTHREDGRRHFLTQRDPSRPIRLRIGRGVLSFIASTERRMNNSGVTVARAVLAALSRFTDAERLYAFELAGCPAELV